MTRGKGALSVTGYLKKVLITVVITHQCKNFDFKKFARRLLDTIVWLHVHKVLTTVFKIIRLKFHEILFIIDFLTKYARQLNVRMLFEETLLSKKSKKNQS